MKKNAFYCTVLRICIVLLPLFVVTACSNDEDLTSNEGNPAVNLNSHKEIIGNALGFDTLNMLNMGDYYLVEGDIMLYKDSLRQYISSPATKQAHCGSLISELRQKNIKVGVSSNLPAEWVTATREAIYEWNQIGSNIWMTFDNANPDILIRPDNGSLRNEVIAAGSWPANGKPGNIIIVNLNFLSGRYVAPTTKKYNMVHEIGHCLGLRHTNWKEISEGNANHIAGTPSSDGNSVMNGGTALYTWKGFSSYDIIATKTLYPVKKIVIKPSRNKISMGETVSFSIENIPQDSKANWSVEGKPLILTGQETLRATFKAAYNGRAVIKVSTNYGNAEYSAWVGEPGIDIGEVKHGSTFNYYFGMYERIHTYAATLSLEKEVPDQYAIFKIIGWGNSENRTIGMVRTSFRHAPNTIEMKFIYGDVK